MGEGLRDVLGGMGWTTEPPTARGQARDRWESFQALVDQAEDFATERGVEASVATFVEDLDRRAAEQHAPTADGVTLATFHAAKGLEWDAVFCCGVQDGTVPITYASQEGAPAGAVEEERRLLYVGMTRARKELMVSWAAARNPGRRRGARPRASSSPCCRPPSSRRPPAGGPRWPAAATASQPLATAAEKKRGAVRPTTPRATTRSSSTASRRGGSRPRGRGARTASRCRRIVVFTDATLELIAEQKPTSITALAKVNGVGPNKIERYGEAVLALVAEARIPAGEAGFRKTSEKPG